MKKYLWSNKQIITFFLSAFGINIGLSFIHIPFFIKYPFIAYIVQTIIIVAFFWICIVRNNQSFTWKKLGFGKYSIWKSIGIAFSAWLITMIILVLLYQLFYFLPGFKEQNSYTDIFGNSTIQQIGFAILAIIIAPILEETIFRGFVMQWSLERMNSFLSVMLCAFSFAIFHLQFSSFIPLFLLGVTLSIITVRSKSIYPAIIFHILNNSFAFILTILTHAST